MRVVPVLADIADAAAVESMVKQGLAELGAIDILVCNAAIGPHQAITETSLDDWHRVVESTSTRASTWRARSCPP